MPILRMTTELLAQECPGCRAVNQVDILELHAGSERSPDEIRLPRCPMCGHAEILIRGRVNQHLVEPLQAQLLAMSLLHRRLLEAGRGHPRQLLHFAAESLREPYECADDEAVVRVPPLPPLTKVS